MAKIPVGILGATGEVGQKFVVNLQRHPWFELTALYASEKSAGKTYADALNYGGESSRWFCKEAPDKKILNMTVLDVRNVRPDEGSLFFSALPSETALETEGNIAKEKPVVSTASAYRYFDDSFVYMPSVNESHVGIIEQQRKGRGWKGFVVPQPNCTTIGLAMSLKPIHDGFGLESVIMASMQSVSGAGYGAVRDWAAQRKAQGSDLPAPLEKFSHGMFEGNVIPYIRGEEEKVKKETVRLLGEFKDGKIKPAGFKIACKCNRVPTLYGHTESVFIDTAKKCSIDELKEAWKNYRGEPQRLALPTAPKQPIIVMDEIDRPQPRFDSDIEGGMVAVIGGVEANAFDNGFQYTVLSHNTELGAAKGAVLAAEYLYKIGLIET
ncbi:MAG: aspartate-semialdehyde dehydrogenase family protein [Candidatus Hodarchaeaceae archaeon]|nr:aspartate-semialdehyde dehydrogenase family protein [Candidatus Hodarchaeaceae archaeon]